jgi:putative oxidoreductase
MSKGTSILARVLTPQTDAAYVLLRVVAGLMFAFHGVQKVFGVLTQRAPELGSQLWVGGVIELVCGIAIAAGMYTTWAAFLASGTMAVAYTQFHWKLALGERFFPAVNKGELALLYAVVFLFIACRGINGLWLVVFKQWFGFFGLFWGFFMASYWLTVKPSSAARTPLPSKISLPWVAASMGALVLSAAVLLPSIRF